MAERNSVLKDYDTGVFTVADLSRRYGVSLETIYVWKRWHAGGDQRWFEGPLARGGCLPARDAA
ncbi:MAG: helix-turn-helix domain-containing protein [Hyphomicrobium aestuarii]|nr:helix-turn-helix domain-containing protein [Hyphomicrobium aestuarii]